MVHDSVTVPYLSVCTFRLLWNACVRNAGSTGLRTKKFAGAWRQTSRWGEDEIPMVRYRWKAYQVEEKKRKEDSKRQKLRKEVDLPDAVKRINEYVDAHVMSICSSRTSRMNDPAQIRRRAPLVLPAPQVSDVELEQVSRQIAIVCRVDSHMSLDSEDW